MKLLIVDDQQATRTGIAQGIDWAAEGFSFVETAQNAMEARLCFARAVPDVMLCDIEMPVESGIELSTWVRQQRYDTAILFLTCHAEIGFAQQAIKLQAADYILQPASYQEIRNKVRRALGALREARSQRLLKTLGEGYVRKQMLVDASVWRSYLIGNLRLDALLTLPNMPDPDKPGWLVLQQLVQWRKPDAEWRKGLLMEALHSFLQDVFSPYTRWQLAAFMDYDLYAIFLQPGGERLTREETVSLLQYLGNCYDTYMPCSCGLYLSELSTLQQLPAVWERLAHFRDQDLSGRKGVFLLSENGGPVDLPCYISQRQNWIKAYQQGGKDSMLAAARDSLAQMSGAHQLTSRTLRAFQNDWIETVFSLSGAGMESLETPQGNTLMRHSTSSAQDMQRLMEYMVGCCLVNEEQNTVQQIIRYIHDNLYRDIRREELAELVHLNGDYLTRFFKKHTGYSPKSYIIREKMLAARQLLRTTGLSVGSVAMQLGYSNFSHFATSYKKEFGILPGEEGRKPEEEKV